MILPKLAIWINPLMNGKRFAQSAFSGGKLFSFFYAKEWGINIMKKHRCSLEKLDLLTSVRANLMQSLDENSITLPRNIPDIILSNGYEK